MKALLLMLLSLTLFTGFSQTTKKQPVTIKSQSGSSVALTFINAYVKQILSRDKKKLSLASWIQTNTLLTPTFKAKYKTLYDSADPEFGLEMDPILSAQDMPEKGFVISKADASQGYVTVSGIGWTDFKVIMKVVQLNNKWMVDGSGIVNIPEGKQIKP